MKVNRFKIKDPLGRTQGIDFNANNVITLHWFWTYSLVNMFVALAVVFLAKKFTIMS